MIRAKLLTLGTVAAAVLSLPALAEESDRGHPEHHGVQVAANDGHDHGQDAHDHGKDHGHEDKGHYDAKTFASVKEAWAFLGTATADAEKLAAEGKIEPIHELAEQIGAAVHTLEDKSDMVTGDAKTKLTAALKQLDKAADELHHSTEGKDADATALNLKKVKGLLPLIQGLYPAGAL
jgi:ABC-type Zn2+ transport system substrate-binding protein/surface adhesin